MAISSNIIETIKSKANIVDIIGEHVSLTKKGKNYVGLCPFHEDNTPSFSVNPILGIYKCFACGASGDVFDFLEAHMGLSFPEAIRFLAKKYNIEMPDNISDNERELYKKRESMYIANDYALKFFVENLNSGSNDALTALKYARERWSVDYIKTFGIGYASNDWHSFCDYAKTKGLDMDLLLELGLIIKHTSTGHLYDAYRGRVVIPIRNKGMRIVGFTARRVPELSTKDKQSPKYINSPSSLIFDKSSVLFGIDRALKYAVKADEMNLVEGAPDVMRLQIIGIYNTVATLGSTWSKAQLEIIKHVASKINIIPDNDLPRNGVDFGAGFMSAISTGKLALSLGFQVTVQEIPSEGGKADPDSYLQSVEMLNLLTKKDFVLWYAEKKINAANNDIGLRSKAFHEIINIVKSTKDYVLAETYAKTLGELYGYKDMWHRELSIVEKPCKKTYGYMSDEEYISLFDGTEIIVGKNSYLCYTKDGETEMSNFIMIPLYLIRDNSNSTRVFILRNVDGLEVKVEFSIDEMTVLQKFRNRIEREVNYMWYGSSAKFNKLRGILYSKMEVITKVSTLGWQKQGFYAFSNGIVKDGDWFPADAEGIVRILSSQDSFYLPAFSRMNQDQVERFLFERKFYHQTDSTVRFSNFSELMFKVYGSNAIIGICYLIACLFRDIIICSRREFPTLFLFGPKGTGKTAFGELLQSPFVYCGDHPNLRTSTLASLAIVLSQAENAMMHFDEYKNDIDIDKIELLKGLWDCQGRTKLDIDTHKREQSRVLSGVIISGQEKPTVDIALYSRQCILPFNQDTHTIEEKLNFRTLKEWEHEGTSYVVLELLKIRKHFEEDYQICYEEASKEICSEISYSIDERILHNWSVIFASYKACADHISFPFSYQQVFSVIISSIVSQNEECQHSNELSGFWRAVDYLNKDNQILGLADYRIRELTCIRVDIKLENKKKSVTREFGCAKKLMVIPTNSRLFTLYTLHHQRTHEKVIPINTLKYYLENSPEYIGKINSMRFASVDAVKEWLKTHGHQKQEGVKGPSLNESPVQAYCFDLESIDSSYGINLSYDYMASDEKSSQ